MDTTVLTVFAFAFIFLMTTGGAAMIYLMRRSVKPKINALVLGFAAGIMITASIWSLLIPAIEQSASALHPWLPVTVGFLAGGLFLVLLDNIIPHQHVATGQIEGPQSSWAKSIKLFLAMTIHNIPEGLAVGFAFGAAAAGYPDGELAAGTALTAGMPQAYLTALGLAIGIGLQNFPEGAAVAFPLYQSTGSKHKAFLYGMGSGAVEPVAAVAGLLLASSLQPLQPWFMAFAAGAMIFVVAEDLIPEAHTPEHAHWSTWGVMFGFLVMMLLEIFLPP